jgi:hypothetical protein
VETTCRFGPSGFSAEPSGNLCYIAGRYRISLEGFKAINVTAEDPFRADGRGDEVFITTQVNEYTPTPASSTT